MSAVNDVLLLPRSGEDARTGRRVGFGEKHSGAVASRVWSGQPREESGLEAVILQRSTRKELRAVRPQIQLVFQDPWSSLNPRFTALEIVREPLICNGVEEARNERQRAIEMLERVGLSREMASRELANSVVDRGKGWPSHVHCRSRRNSLFLDEAFVGPRLLGAGADRQSVDGVAIVLRTGRTFLSRTIWRWPRTWVMKFAVMDRRQGRGTGRSRKGLACARTRSHTPGYWRRSRDRASRPRPAASFVMRFLLRRLIHAVFLLFGVSILTFLLPRSRPGDYFGEMRLDFPHRS